MFLYIYHIFYLTYIYPQNRKLKKNIRLSGTYIYNENVRYTLGPSSADHNICTVLPYSTAYTMNGIVTIFNLQSCTA